MLTAEGVRLDIGLVRKFVKAEHLADVGVSRGRHGHVDHQLVAQIACGCPRGDSVRAVDVAVQASVVRLLGGLRGSRLDVRPLELGTPRAGDDLVCGGEGVPAFVDGACASRARGRGRPVVVACSSRSR